MSLVSVVMPVLDGEAHLAEAIESILAQSHEALELIVVDDGSSDSSVDIAAGFAASDRRVRLVRRERDPQLTSGARAANQGIALAKGEWIARMDQDDIALPERLAVQLDFLRAAGLDACGSQVTAFGSGEDQLYWFPEGQSAMERELVFRVAMLHPSMVVSAELMRRLPYDESVTHDDYEWQIRAIAVARLGNCRECLLRHRVHPAQANVVHRGRFTRDLRRYRLRQVYRLFPHTPAREFEIVNAIAERARFTHSEEVEAAGNWLVRLADLPDPELRRMMLHRWEGLCRRAKAEDIEDLRSRVAARILGAA
jgi:glycosyltransferase involved in cell wall biosynthesis